MQSMLKQMGIAQQEINAERVIIETKDSNIIIENPSVAKVSMQGQVSFQISGNISEQDKEQEKAEENKEDYTQEDIKTIIERTKCTEKQAQKELENTQGDIAQAIINLSQ